MEQERPQEQSVKERVVGVLNAGKVAVASVILRLDEKFANAINGPEDEL